MKELTLKNPRKLGEADPKYGQSYWSYTHDSDMPVMFNLMEGEVGDGSVITAETVELKESSKGTEYHRLKKVKILSGSRSATPPVANDTSKTLELILENTTRTLEILQQPSGYEKAKATAASIKGEIKPDGTLDTVIEDIGDEPINLNDIPF